MNSPTVVSSSTTSTDPARTGRGWRSLAAVAPGGIDVARPLARALCLGEVAGEPPVGERPFAFAGQCHIAHDPGEQVVEVVRDAAGQLADGFHLLRLAKLRLELRAVVLDAQLHYQRSIEPEDNVSPL